MDAGQLVAWERSQGVVDRCRSRGRCCTLSQQTYREVEMRELYWIETGLFGFVGMIGWLELE